MSELYKEDFTRNFQIFLNSADAITGATTPSDMIFSMGSILSQAPNIQNFQDCAYCKITLSYFCCEQTAAHFTGVGTTTLKVKIANKAYPNNIESKLVGVGQSYNVISSDLIGCVPVGNTDAVYSNSEYDNTPVVIQNPFDGDLHIMVTDQDNLTPFTMGAVQPINMLLKVEFPEKIDPRVKNNISTLI